MIDLLRLFSLSATHSCLGVIFVLFDLSFTRFFAMCVHLLNGGVWYAWNSVVNVAATGSPVLMLFAFIVVGFSRIWVRWILTTMLRFGASVTRGNLGD